ncbi:hypothetical protein [Burkholderia vietnamiensis]|uniref:hypothetical protein n=1 Tax=Burkholderia vietnamiensis TaxID=60552 RepID=UPI0009BCC7FD|nr:hypothetical protein [Burkholderia vietnamiensis]
MKRVFVTVFTALCGLASAATLAPVQLLNPAGSTAGQAIVSTGPATAPTWGSVGLNGISAVPANTVLANATNASAKATAFSMPSCSTSSSALNYTSGAGIGCNSSINASTLGGTAAAAYALLASPAFTGAPTAPTASAGTNTTQLATTAFTNAIFAAPPAFGNTTPAAVSATTLSASSTVSGSGFSTYLASPPAIGATTPAAGKFTTLQATGAITPSSTAGIVGTTTNDNASAGSVGEYPTPTNLTGVSLTSGAAANGASVSLTAGDWDIVGTCQFLPAGSTTISSVITAVNSTSATLPGAPNETAIQATLTTGAQQIISTPPSRVQPTTTTTYYTVCLASFGTSTMTVNGYIRARRPR